MATSAPPASFERSDLRTVVGGGVVLGVVAAVGVVVFALASRVLAGTVETVVQSLLILLGGVVVSYGPAGSVRPRSAEAIAWAATVGLLGALTFTVIDTAILRPVNLYHWTWDEIGGGSGFWYIPVWWMGSAVLAWLGSWTFAVAARRAGTPNIPGLAGMTLGLSLLVFAMLVVTDIAPFRSAVMALSFSLALVAQVPIAAMLARR